MLLIPGIFSVDFNTFTLEDVLSGNISVLIVSRVVSVVEIIKELGAISCSCIGSWDFSISLVIMVREPDEITALTFDSFGFCRFDDALDLAAAA